MGLGPNPKYGIKCCHHCESRFPGCHAECPQYLKEKAQFEIDKAKAKENIGRVPRIGKHDFDMLACMHRTRRK